MKLPDELVERAAKAAYSQRHGPSMSGPHPTSKDFEMAYAVLEAALSEGGEVVEAVKIWNPMRRSFEQWPAGSYLIIGPLERIEE